MTSIDITYLLIPSSALFRSSVWIYECWHCCSSFSFVSFLKLLSLSSYYCFAHSTSASPYRLSRSPSSSEESNPTPFFGQKPLTYNFCLAFVTCIYPVPVPASERERESDEKRRIPRFRVSPSLRSGIRKLKIIKTWFAYFLAWETFGFFAARLIPNKGQRDFFMFEEFITFLGDISSRILLRAPDSIVVIYVFSDCSCLSHPTQSRNRISWRTTRSTVFLHIIFR